MIPSYVSITYSPRLTHAGPELHPTWHRAEILATIPLMEADVNAYAAIRGEACFTHRGCDSDLVF